MDVKDIKKLLESMTESGVNELSFETGDFKLSVKRGADLSPQISLAQAPQVAPEVQPQAAAPTSQEPTPTQAEAPAPVPTSNYKEVTAPIVGTFYASSAPDAPPYVKVGDRVDKGAVLCIIEAMKLMNEIEAEVAGTVAEILVNNEEPVEYGQVLFRIDPS